MRSCTLRPLLQLAVHLPLESIKEKQPAPIVSTNYYATNAQLGAIPPQFIHQLGRSRWVIDAQAFQTITAT